MKLSIQAVAESLASEVIKVPTSWFRSLHDETSVWDQLYEWLRKAGYAGPNLQRGNVYIGHNLMGKLLEAEKRRIRRSKPRASPQQQTRAFEWSNLQGAPQGCWGPQFHGISGNGLVVENPLGFIARKPGLRSRKT